MRCPIVQYGATAQYLFDHKLTVLAPISAQNISITFATSIYEILLTEIKNCVQFWVSMQATAGPFPRADAAPTQPQGRSGKHCLESAHGRSTLGNENGKL
jgi:hypothetical protein